MIAASYELDKLGRERYYEAKLSEQKQHYTEQHSRHLENKVASLQEENVELKLKLKEIRGEQREAVEKAVKRVKMEASSEKEIAL